MVDSNASRRDWRRTRRFVGATVLVVVALGTSSATAGSYHHGSHYHYGPWQRGWHGPGLGFAAGFGAAVLLSPPVVYAPYEYAPYAPDRSYEPPPEPPRAPMIAPPPARPDYVPFDYGLGAPRSTDR